MRPVRFAPLLLLLAGCSSEEAPKPVTEKPVAEAPKAPQPEKEAPVAKPEEKRPESGKKEVVTASGLKYEDLLMGDGPAAKAGDSLEMHYIGWLTDGTKFDSSLDSGRVYGFQLGARQVIGGWDEGVAGMKAGGRRRLVIPPQLGYGARGCPPVIPPNATLVFEVQLIRIR